MSKGFALGAVQMAARLVMFALQRLNGLVVITVVSSFLLVCSPVRAEKISPVQPCASSDCLTILDATGAIQYSVGATEDQETDAPGRLFFIDVAGLANQNMVYSPTFVMDGLSATGKISDAFGVVLKGSEDSAAGSEWSHDNKDSKNKSDDKSENESNHSVGCDKDCDYVLAFVSDPLGLDKSVCGTKTNCVPEGIGMFDATPYLSPAFLQTHPGWTAVFKSDSEVVPEPAPVGVLCGLGALALFVWKRRSVS
jgi:hypothetical protein